MAREYAESDADHAAGLDRVAALLLPKTITFRELPALQAADFMTWELRKHHEKLSEWYDLDGKPFGDDARWDDQQRWSQEKFGSPLPPPRKSMAALVDGNGIFPIIWDYDRLCEAHRLRAGKWSL